MVWRGHAVEMWSGDGHQSVPFAVSTSVILLRRKPLSQTRQIYCCGCGCDVLARLTNGQEIYPGRDDLAERPFWKCDPCDNYVGCHWQTDHPTRPLGSIATPDLRRERREIHRILNPLCKQMGRKAVYADISAHIGRPYHTAEIRTVEAAREIYRIIRTLETTKP